MEIINKISNKKQLKNVICGLFTLNDELYLIAKDVASRPLTREKPGMIVVVNLTNEKYSLLDLDTNVTPVKGCLEIIGIR